MLSVVVAAVRKGKAQQDDVADGGRPRRLILSTRTQLEALKKGFVMFFLDPDGVS